MAKFDPAETVAVAEIQQLLGDRTCEVYHEGGLRIIEADLLTTDCRCKLLDEWIEGRDAIAAFYRKPHD